MKKTTKTIKAVKPKIGLYKATIKVLGKTYEAKGKDAVSAIESLEVGKVAKGMAVLMVEHEGKSVSKIISGPQVSRLFSQSKLMREIALKNVSLMFGGI